MSSAQELIYRLVEIGATIEAADARLIIRAGERPVPGELVRRIRDSKAEVLAALSPGWWRREFVVRTIDRELDGFRSHDAAARLAWGELECRWHGLHGERIAVWQCAGCGEPIGGLPALNLSDSNRVHVEKLDCLMRFGERWRGEARRALVVMGLQPPAGRVSHER
jgi:hypothetical protein